MKRSGGWGSKRSGGWGSKRSGYMFLGAALGLAAGSAVVAWTTMSGAEVVARPLIVLAMLSYAGSLVLGSSRWIGASALPMMSAVVVEAAFVDEPSWIRSMALGCLWFLSLEAGWEAIERRSRHTYSTAANVRRTQEVATVIGGTLMVGLVAVAATEFAPVRSVPLQALVIGGLLIAFITMIRNATHIRET